MSHLVAVLSAGLFLAVAGCTPESTAQPGSRLTSEPTTVDLDLGPADLFAGYEAHRVLMQGNGLVLDTRNWSTGGLPGRVITDVIEANSGANVALPVKVTDLKLTTVGDAPPGSKIITMLRHGPTFFQSAGWSDWETLSTISPGEKSASGGVKDLGRDCYVQFRADLVSESPNAAPLLRGMSLSLVRQVTQRFEPQLQVKECEIPRIVRSTIQFAYERPDQKDLAWLRKECKLDALVAGKKTEMEKLVAVLEWASTRKNVRGAAGDNHLGGMDPYPWNIRKIFSLDDGGTVYGHCASYSQLIITAAVSLGWQARHFNDEGYRTCTHEVLEVWVNELAKWVYFDPSLGTYYTDKDGKPLSITEMHDLFVEFYCEPGKTLKDYLPRVENLEQDKGWLRRKAIDFKKLDVTVKTNDYTYGEKKPWDWTDGQGIMSAGFLQLTPRNNFHSQPNPPFLRYGYSPEGVNGFPCWSDEKTPLWYDDANKAKGEKFPDGLTRNWFVRRRDFNWTLNQASIRMVRTGVGEIAVEVGTSQPFFRKFVATMNGKSSEVKSPFMWKITPGENSLTVNCVDEFDRPGIPSTVKLEMGK
ncbi:MAG: hypothetical protein PHU85_14270 [Phycisphaerae bacterium]|nr:hypothetical protein [Phycisphaerae bacterium]